jgi:hypothetical protein
LTWLDIYDDINAGPDDGAIRYGLVRDTGSDGKFFVNVALTFDNHGF